MEAILKPNKHKELEKTVRNWERYPGGLADFTLYKQKEFDRTLGVGIKKADYEGVPLEGQYKFVFIDRDQDWKILERIAEEGCSAIVNYRPREYTYLGLNTIEIGGYGTPVRETQIIRRPKL